jgi:hypothetical protein
MKLLKALAASALLAAASQAQIVLSAFNSAVDFGAANGPTAGTVTFAGGGTDIWAFTYAAPLNLVSATGNWSLTGNVNAGNTSGSVVVALYDSTFTPVASAAYTGFTTTPSTLVASPSVIGSLADVAFLVVSGDGNPTATVNFTLDQLSIVPEPSQVALGLGALAIGAAVVARRRKA